MYTDTFKHLEEIEAFTWALGEHLFLQQTCKTTSQTSTP